MLGFPRSVQRLIKELSKLPSIGEKSATRLAYHLVNNDRELAVSLAQALSEMRNKVQLCKKCFFICEEELCTVCQDSKRETGILCVVEKPMDLIAIERVGEYRGQYHVLHGVWAPLRGLGPESMKIKELLERVQQDAITEVILATSSTVEGDATALYAARVLNELSVKTSRLAQGMPKGGELEYLDDVTLSRAFQGRSAIGQ